MINNKAGFHLFQLIYSHIKKEVLFYAFLALMVVLTIISPQKIPHYPSYVDWRTIISLTLLIILSKGFKESGFFELTADRLLVHYKSEKSIAIFFVFLTLILSTFLTNDITLFIVVPLTVSLQKFLKNDLSKLVVFEAIAANVGSTLTPIGNPQNLFLWHQWEIPFFAFIIQMFPLFLLLAFMLMAFSFVIFKRERLEINECILSKLNKKLFVLTTFFMIFFLLSLILGKRDLLVLVIVVPVYFIFYRKLLFQIDYFLLFTFIIMFIDFNLLTQLEPVCKLVQIFQLERAGNLFIVSSLLSQITSNVPASIFLAHLSNDYRTIAYGVNVGGQGFIIGSLANLIALRILGDKSTYSTFHLYSVPFFIVSAVAAYLLFY
jgi:Na+/H+ antiporter NhaD/arsenite permease-like protein